MPTTEESAFKYFEQRLAAEINEVARKAAEPILKKALADAEAAMQGAVNEYLIKNVTTWYRCERDENQIVLTINRNEIRRGY